MIERNWWMKGSDSPRRHLYARTLDERLSIHAEEKEQALFRADMRRAATLALLPVAFIIGMYLMSA